MLRGNDPLVADFRRMCLTFLIYKGRLWRNTSTQLFYFLSTPQMKKP